MVFNTISCRFLIVASYLCHPVYIYSAAFGIINVIIIKRNKPWFADVLEGPGVAGKPWFVGEWLGGDRLSADDVASSSSVAEPARKPVHRHAIRVNCLLFADANAAGCVRHPNAGVDDIVLTSKQTSWGQHFAGSAWRWSIETADVVGDHLLTTFFGSACCFGSILWPSGADEVRTVRQWNLEGMIA